MFNLAAPAPITTAAIMAGVVVCGGIATKTAGGATQVGPGIIVKV